jgi:hypothetical protein
MFAAFGLTHWNAQVEQDFAQLAQAALQRFESEGESPARHACRAATPTRAIASFARDAYGEASTAGGSLRAC